jgi:hypothetical protein
MINTSHGHRTLWQLARILREPYLRPGDRLWRGRPCWKNPSFMFYYGLVLLMTIFQAKTYWGWW